MVEAVTRARFQTFIGVDLGGGKGKNTAVALLRRHADGVRVEQYDTGDGHPSDDDTTVAYHGDVSSNEPFYCSPSGGQLKNVNGVDVVSCASAFCSASDTSCAFAAMPERSSSATTSPSFTTVPSGTSEEIFVW